MTHRLLNRLPRSFSSEVGIGASYLSLANTPNNIWAWLQHIYLQARDHARVSKKDTNSAVDCHWQKGKRNEKTNKHMGKLIKETNQELRQDKPQ